MLQRRNPFFFRIHLEEPLKGNLFSVEITIFLLFLWFIIKVRNLENSCLTGWLTKESKWMAKKRVPCCPEQISRNPGNFVFSLYHHFVPILRFIMEVRNLYCQILKRNFISSPPSEQQKKKKANFRKCSIKHVFVNLTRFLC